MQYRTLIECGETWKRFGIDNRPKQLDTYEAISQLCVQIPDPIVDHLGPITITFGFASPELDRLIRKHWPKPNTRRRTDQHAGHEVGRSGQPYCSRLGQACDFHLAGARMREVAHWLTSHTPLDRLYWHGDDHPVHVSFGPDHARSCWRLPRPFTAKAIDLETSFDL